MKKHFFRLENYLKIKIFEEKNCLSSVLQQQSRVDILERRLQSLEAQMRETKEDLSRPSQETYLFAPKVAWGEESLRATKEVIIQLKEALAKELRILEKLKAKHLEARKDVKVIEKLKEQSKTNFKEKLNKEDSKKMSEIAQQTYLRGRGQNE